MILRCKVEAVVPALQKALDIFTGSTAANHELSAVADGCIRKCTMAKVSIIMGIYNCAATLPEAIDSILAQTFPDWQLVLCDDGSKHNTYAVAKAYQ